MRIRLANLRTRRGRLNLFGVQYFTAGLHFESLFRIIRIRYSAKITTMTVKCGLLSWVVRSWPTYYKIGRHCVQ